MNWIIQLKPLQLLIYGYLFILTIGCLLLCMPIFQAQEVTVLDNLFTATSALSTTGLATLNIAESYNLAGEIIILILIQVGGLGFMSIGSFIVLMRKRRLSELNAELIRFDFSLPENFSIFRFVKNLILFTLFIEIIGAILLSIIFYYNGEDAVIWKGIFHSISAFCTAGFSLFSDSFVDYQSNFYLNAVISFLSIAGALGFIFFTDVIEVFKGKKAKITLTSRIIYRVTFLGMIIGTAVLFLSDETIVQLPAEHRLMVAFFQSMTAFTTVGFNTCSIDAISSAPLFFLIILMIIGASPSGTGGGMKSTTISALYAQLRATFRGDIKVSYMGRNIPGHRIRMASSNFFFYVLVVAIGTYFLLLVESEQNIFPVFFEAVSALGTVGISMGITGDLSPMGKLFTMLLMFLGRIGPLSFGIALFNRDQDDAYDTEEDLVI